jgi:DNA-binding IclR family transcriptional regulator
MSIGIKSTVKALQVLKLFSLKKSEWALQDMAEALGYHKSSIQRIVATLESEGFLKRVHAHKGIYRLGPQLLFLGNLAEMSTDLRSIARPIMTQLVDRIHETTYLCVLDGYQCLYIEKVECSQPIRIIHAIGQRNPLHCTGVGKVLLSGMSQEESRRYLDESELKAFTPTTITDPKLLWMEIAAVKNKGVAYDREELNLGVKCVAAPIINNQGKVIAAISVSGPGQRFTARAMRRFENEIKEAAGNISKEIGFLPTR